MSCSQNNIEDADELNDSTSTIENLEEDLSSEPDTAITQSHTVITTEGKEFTSAFICPNRCKGSGNARPGNCSCGMELIENPSYEHE
jgi:hypothetical protein